MNEVVNGLWIGTLGKMQILSIRSFLKQGHRYKLWVYDHMKNVPKGVEICDANLILDKRHIFRHWTGNLATFADIFRYKLLYDNNVLACCNVTDSRMMNERLIKIHKGVDNEVKFRVFDSDRKRTSIY